MTDAQEARCLVEKLAADLARDEATAAHLRETKRSLALTAARGGAKAKRELADLNDQIVRQALHLEDLGTALSQARDELAAAEASEQRARDRERADQIGALAEQLAESAAAIDAVLEALGVAFGRRDEIADQLYRLHPPLARNISLRVQGDDAATRAARTWGLHRFLRLPWSGDPRHEVALASGFPIPEILELTAKLRGEPEQKAA